MVRMISKKLLVAAVLFGCASANAALLQGELQFFGSASADAAQLDQASGLTDFVVNFVVGTEDLVGTFTLDISDLILGVAPGDTLLTNEGIVFTSSQPAVDIFSDPTSLDIEVIGRFIAPGFDDTPGRLLVTADSFGELVTFSGSVRAIPLPGAILLMLSALTVVGVRSRAAA